MKKIIIPIFMALLLPSAVYANDTVGGFRFLFSSDHLEPETRPFATQTSVEYYGMVIESFKDSYESNVKARVIVLPSFQPEYVVYLVNNEDGYSIVTLKAQRSFWGFYNLSEAKEKKKKYLEDPNYKRQEIENMSLIGIPDSAKYEIIRKQRMEYIDVQIKGLEPHYPENHAHEIPIIRCEKTIEPQLADSIVRVWNRMLLETRYYKRSKAGLDGVSYHFSMHTHGQFLAGKTRNPKGEKTRQLVSIVYDMEKYCREATSENLESLSQSVSSLENSLK